MISGGASCRRECRCPRHQLRRPNRFGRIVGDHLIDGRPLPRFIDSIFQRTAAKPRRKTEQELVDDRQNLVAELKPIRSDVLVDDERRFRFHGPLDLLEGVLELLDVMEDRVGDDDVVGRSFERVAIEIGD